MEASAKNRRLLRLQGATFAILFLAVIGLLAWLSTRYHLEADWTANGRHTLSSESVALLKQLKDPVTITAFARKSQLSPVRKQIADLVDRYRHVKSDITLHFVDPDMSPDKVRAAGVTMDGELVIDYQGRTQHVQRLSEEAITNALQQLARTGKRKILFLSGHGERNPDGHANFDLGNFGEQLRNKGLQIGLLNLTKTPSIPTDAAVLVIASPRVNLFPGEVKLIQNYVENGGNLLWLADPGGLYRLGPLAAQLGLKFDRGTVVDPTTRLLGINNAAFALVTRYPHHAVTDKLASVTLFPFTAALDISAVKAPWHATPLLQTMARSWDESGPLEGEVRYDKGKDIPGPLTIGAALERPHPAIKTTPKAKGETKKEPAAQQRVIVVGDGDFLSNTYLGNGANLELGERMINWLANDDALIHIPPKVATDTKLTMSPATGYAIGIGFLFVLPGGLVGAGILIWLKRRKR